MMILLISACTNDNVNNNDLNTDNENDNEVIENPISNDEIDRSKYLTGEIITDGVYTYPSKGFGIIYFVLMKKVVK